MSQNERDRPPGLWVVAHGAKIEREALVAALARLDERGLLDGWSVDLRLTSADVDARALALEASRAGADRVIAMGGDGTVNEVVDGILASPGPRPALGIVPLGTANDLATTLAVPSELDDALELALEAVPRPIDVGRVDGRVFINVVTGGVMSEATAELDPALKQVEAREARFEVEARALGVCVRGPGSLFSSGRAPAELASD